MVSFYIGIKQASKQAWERKVMVVCMTNKLHPVAMTQKFGMTPLGKTYQGIF